MIRASIVVFAACIVAGAWSLTGALAGGNNHVPVPDFPVGGSNFFLGECAALKDPKRNRCYIRGLLELVEKSGSPARELPLIDR